MNPTYDVFSDNQMKLIKQDTIACLWEVPQVKERWLLETNSCGQFLVHSRKIAHAVFQKLYVWHHSNWKNNKEYGKKEKTDLTKKILLIVETLELTILV